MTERSIAKSKKGAYKKRSTNLNIVCPGALQLHRRRVHHVHPHNHLPHPPQPSPTPHRRCHYKPLLLPTTPCGWLRIGRGYGCSGLRGRSPERNSRTRWGPGLGRLRGFSRW